MKNLFLFLALGSMNVTARAEVMPTASYIQKVRCYDKTTGRLRYQIDKIPGHEKLIYGVSTDIYIGSWESVSEPSMMLTADRDNAVYFMSGLTPKEDSLTVNKQTGEGHLVLLNMYAIVATDIMLDCKIN